MNRTDFSLGDSYPLEDGDVYVISKLNLTTVRADLTNRKVDLFLYGFRRPTFAPRGVEAKIQFHGHYTANRLRSLSRLEHWTGAAEL